MKSVCALTISLAAGCIATPAIADDRTQIKTDAVLPANTIGHIYYNAVTGEKIATLFNNGIRPAAGAQGFEVWAADNTLPCADFGQTSGNAVIIDAPNGEFGFSTVEGDTILDWADIPADTVVDTLQLTYYSTIQDVDLDSDSIGDGVEGFGVQWIFYDEENGFNHCSCRAPLVGFTLVDLPGQLDGGFGGYILSIDLAGGFGSSISFELGDSDSDLQGAAFHNPYVFNNNQCGDMDSDGLSDFGYSINYIQPGRIDLDNADGDSDTTTGIDGDPANAGLTAVGLAHYRGQTIEIDNGDGTFSYEVILAPGINAFGAEDAFDIFDNTGFYTGTFWMGGFACSNPDGGLATPFAQVELVMFAPRFIEPCDYNGDGVSNIFDVFAYLDDFNAGDLAADFTGDGSLDIFDFFAFLDAFNAGCP